MKNIKINVNNQERVEVMALFGYEMTPCQPLSFKRRGDVREIEVTELLEARIKFIGATAMHIFECLAGKDKYRLEFNSNDLSWHLA